MTLCETSLEPHVVVCAYISLVVDYLGALAKVTAEGKSVDNGDPLLAGLSVASTSLHCDIKDGSAVVNESALNDPAIPVKPTPLQDARAIEVLKPEHKVSPCQIEHS